MSTGTHTCRICGGAGLGTKPFGYRFHGKWLQAVACNTCGIIFLDPQPGAEEIAAMYSKEYFEGDFRCGHAGSYFDDGTLGEIVDHQLLARIRRHKPVGRFLEVGCAGGAFLDAARTAGYDVQGVEFSDDAAALARKKFSLEVFTGDIREAALTENHFDIVFMGDVIEHLPDPVGALNEINRVLKMGGLLVLACPMQTNTLFSRLGFALYRVLGRTATVTLPPYHLFEYRPISMNSLVQHCGFAVIESRQAMIPPGEVTLRGPVLQRAGKKLLQYPNSILTSVFGIFGDRLELYAEKQTLPRIH